jgi:anti-sigma factor RsiW
MRSECSQFDDYVGGWMDEPTTAAFERHLSVCSACRSELQTQRRVDALLVAARDQLDPIPTELVRRVRGRLDAQSHGRAVVRLGLSVLGAAAAIAILFVLPSSPIPKPAEPRSPFPESFARRRVALDELAMLVARGNRKSPTETTVWLRPVSMPAPGPHGPSRRVGPRSIWNPETAAEAFDLDAIEITRGLPPYRARAVASRLTLGIRRWRGSAVQEPNPSRVDSREPNEL